MTAVDAAFDLLVETVVGIAERYRERARFLLNHIGTVFYLVLEFIGLVCQLRKILMGVAVIAYFKAFRG